MNAVRDIQIGEGESRFCSCGREIYGRVNLRRDDMEEPEDVIYPRTCGTCSQNRLEADLRDAQERKQLQGMARPSRSLLSGEAFELAKRLWLDSRRSYYWKPAKVRNRCWCGGRNVDRFIKLCALHLDGHRKNVLGNLWERGYDDAKEAERLARIWGLTDFLNDLKGGTGDGIPCLTAPISPA